MNRPIDYSKVLTEEERGALLGDDPKHRWIYSREDMRLNRMVYFALGFGVMAFWALVGLWLL